MVATHIADVYLIMTWNVLEATTPNDCHVGKFIKYDIDRHVDHGSWNRGGNFKHLKCLKEDCSP